MTEGPDNIAKSRADYTLLPPYAFHRMMLTNMKQSSQLKQLKRLLCL